MNANTLRYIIAGSLILAAFVAGNVVMKVYQDNSPEAKAAAEMEKKKRPGFVLPDLDGVERDVREWDGQVVVVNFWATWCPPCRKEMPAFLELQEQYGSRGLQFVGIALDEASKVQDFVDGLGVDYPILLGGERAVLVSDSYGNRFGALPYTAVIDRSGYIASTHRGELTKETVEKIIKGLL